MLVSKRHCMVVHAAYPVGETRVQRQAQALRREGYEVDILCLRQDGEAARESIQGAAGMEGDITIYRLPLKRHRGRGFLWQMLEYLAFFVLVFIKLPLLHRHRRYGVVQVHNLPDFLVFAALIPRLMGARLILDLHDLMPEFFASRSKRAMSSLPVRLVRWQEQASCRFAHHVITVTDVWKEALVGRGVAADKVTVIMNVADRDAFRRQDSAVAAQKAPGNTPEGLQLIYHGAFTHRYGVDLALAAVDEARKQIPALHLSLLGDGESRAELERIIAERGLQEHVTLSQGMLPVSDLAPHLAKAQAGIVPNRSDIFTDGLLPTKLMEYVALGIPVIAARTPTILAYFDSEMVQFFEAGNAHDLAQQIIALHADRDRLAQLARNASCFNERYNWDRIAMTYVSLVQRLNERAPAMLAT